MRLLTCIILLISSFTLENFGFSQADYFTQEELDWIKAHPVIEHGYEPDWPPYEIYEDGEYTGIVGDYLSIIERETGIDFVPIPDISWKESLEKLKKGEINFVPSCAITPEREQFLDFSPVIISDPLVIVTRKDCDFIGSMSYLDNRTICLPKNYYTIEIIRKSHPKINIFEAEKVTDCLNEVSSGRCDAFIGSLGVVSYYINHSGYTNLKIAAPANLENVKISMANTKDFSELGDIVKKVIDRVSVKEHNDIRRKWISVRYEYGISTQQVIRYIIMGALILLIIVGMFFYWNRKLRKEIQKRVEAEKRLSDSFEEISKQNEERKVLLQEIHHRVKNNLQIVSSMIKLQAYKSLENEEQFDYERTIDRINAISLIHEMIYKSENLNVDHIGTYLELLIHEIIQAHTSRDGVSFSIHSNDVRIELKTLVPVAIIVNELVVNSLKHAFQDDQKGEIEITIRNGKRSDMVEIDYRDNGTWKDVPNSGFGSSLIDIFTEQLDGSYTVDTSNGAHYVFSLKRVSLQPEHP